MRVLVAHSAYRGGQTSGENQVVRLEAELLRENGHEVKLMVSDPVADSSLAKARAAASTVWATDRLNAFESTLETFAPDVVHFHNLFPSISPSAIRACANAGIPSAMTLHNYRLMCLPATFFRDGHTCELCLGRVPWRGVALKCYRGSLGASAVLGTSLTLHRGIGTFDKVDLLLAVSEFVKRKHEEGGVRSEGLIVKPNFVKARQRRRGPGEGFLYAGGLYDYKGADLLPGLGQSMRHAILVAGDGPLRAFIEKAPGIRWLGALDSRGVEEAIASARAVLVPSRTFEGAPRVILEAYAAGVPVVASNVGALPELVEDEESGLLIDGSDDHAWVRALDRMADDSESERMGSRAYELWRTRYSPEQGLKNLEKAYALAILRRGRRIGHA